MFRLLVRLLGLAFLAGLIIPPIAAAITKRQYEDAGRGAFDPDADDLDTALIFTGGDYSSRATSFTGGEVLTWYGGGRLDLRDAIIAPGGADLRIRAIFGGVQLIVPETWRVEATTTTPIMGGIANMTRAPAELDAPVLRISTMAIFGGVAIANEPNSMGEGVGEMIRSATDAARDAVDQATSQAKDLSDDASETASEAVETATDAAADVADQAAAAAAGAKREAAAAADQVS